MKAKFIYVFLTCLMIGGQFSLSAQNQVNKDKRQRHTPEQFMERQTNQMVNTLMLDDAAAARFVPVYQNYLKELRECRMMNRRQLSSGQGTEQKGMKPQPKPVLTDAEVEQQIKGRFAQSRKILDVREKYYDEFRKILSPKQIMKIYRTEQNNASKLKKEFDRVILTCGASNPRNINAPGRDAKGIYFAVDYLKRVTKHLRNPQYTDYINAKDKNVLVIGGGDTGNDCVGSSIRQGAKSVVQLEMMPKPPVCRLASNPWPEWPKILKTDYGQQEAIAVFGSDPRIYETTVKEFIKDNKGDLKQVKIVKLNWQKDEKTGRMQMSEIPGSEQILDVDLVFIAAGFLGSEEYVTKEFAVKCTDRTNVQTKQGEYSTSQKGIFTAGDMHRGQSLVVWAIREGREAAREVDKDLMGYTNLN